MAPELPRIAVGLAALGLAAVALLVALGGEAGLARIGHDAAMLPQAMAVRYAGLAVLAVIGAWMNRRDMLVAVMVVLAVIGLGDAIVHFRGGLPFRLHLIAGGLAVAGAFLARFAKS